MTTQTTAQKVAFPLAKLLSTTLLVAGTTIGAGMLGMPLVTCSAGFWPAVGVTLSAWAFMLITGLLLLEVCYQMPEGSNLLSLSEHYLGRRGKHFVGILFVFLYYCLLVAYFAAGASLLSSFLAISIEKGLLLFSVAFGLIVSLGAKSIDRVNSLLTIAMFGAYALLITLGTQTVDPMRLKHSAPAAAMLALPVLFSAFGYHNIIPSLKSYTQLSKNMLRLSLFMGTFLALVIFILWQWMIIGSIPQQALQAALAGGQPVTQALQAATQKPQIYLIGQWFAFFALTTSVLGVCFSMVDFLAEALKVRAVGIRRIGISLLVFLPPSVAVLWNPTLFDKALGLAGGIGEAFLNGFVPLAFFALFLKTARKSLSGHLIKYGLVILTLFCLAVVLIELAGL